MLSTSQGDESNKGGAYQVVGEPKLSRQRLQVFDETVIGSHLNPISEVLLDFFRQLLAVSKEKSGCGRDYRIRKEYCTVRSTRFSLLAQGESEENIRRSRTRVVVDVGPPEVEEPRNLVKRGDHERLCVRLFYFFTHRGKLVCV
jgi:hypothetical protein